MVSIVFRLVVCEAHGSGRSSAISRSKRRNVMATRKNFIEKGRRADPMGSNPHSYGLVFSEYTFSWGSQNAMVTRSGPSVCRQPLRMQQGRKILSHSLQRLRSK